MKQQQQQQIFLSKIRFCNEADPLISKLRRLRAVRQRIAIAYRCCSAHTDTRPASLRKHFLDLLLGLFIATYSKPNFNPVL